MSKELKQRVDELEKQVGDLGKRLEALEGDADEDADEDDDEE